MRCIICAYIRRCEIFAALLISYRSGNAHTSKICMLPTADSSVKVCFRWICVQTEINRADLMLQYVEAMHPMPSSAHSSMIHLARP